MVDTTYLGRKNVLLSGMVWWDIRKDKEKGYYNTADVRYGSGDTEVLEVCYKNIVDLYHEVDEFKFYIRYSALYIYFDVYEISSYSMGYVDLYIMDLQEFLSERCDISECDIVRKQAIFEKIFKPNIRWKSQVKK